MSAITTHLATQPPKPSFLLSTGDAHPLAGIPVGGQMISLVVDFSFYIRTTQLRWTIQIP